MKVPAAYFSLAHKRRALAWQRPFSGRSLERWHKLERCRGGTASLSSSELADVMFKRHVSAINIGHSLTNEFKIEGRFQRVFIGRGANSFFSSHRPFFFWRLKVERGVFANVLVPGSGSWFR